MKVDLLKAILKSVDRGTGTVGKQKVEAQILKLTK